MDLCAVCKLDSARGHPGVDPALSCVSVSPPGGIRPLSARSEWPARRRIPAEQVFN